MKARILKPDEAEKLGLKIKKNKGGGNRSFGVGGVISKKGNKETLQEKFIEKDGKIELLFMSQERIKNLKQRKKFSNYIKQFDKIPSGLK